MAGASRSLLARILFPAVRLSPARIAAAVAGRTIVVTGASYGIGEQVAYLLGAGGAHVVLVARTVDRLHVVADAIGTAGGRAMVMPADLTDPTGLDRLVADLVALPGGVDVLVSNAGKSINRPLAQSLDRHHDVTRTASLNYLAPTRLVLALAPILAARGGQLVSVSAANVLLLPAPGWAAYQASKTAFDQWLRSARPELAAMGIAASTLYLPLVRTRMIAPTRAYDRVPALSPDHAARLVVRAIVTRRARWVPWWLPPLAVASVVLRAPGEMLMARLARAKRA